MKRDKENYTRHLSIALTLTLLLQLLSGCFPKQAGIASPSLIANIELTEFFLSELNIAETKLESTFIAENVILENGRYEYRLSENIISQVYLIETVISNKAEEDIKPLLPEGVDDYDIDWPKVIGKFAVGTSIILAVGVVNCFASSTFFVFGSPVTVAKDAFLGGVIGMAVNEVIGCVREGKDIQRAAKKYAIEGFAEGYMWGAISSVLKIFGENFKRLEKFKLASGGTLRIKLNGTVFDDAGKLVGEAVYGKDGTWYLWNRESKTVLRAFDASGKELVGTALEGIGNLPANEKLRLGVDSSAQICYTDDTGKIMRIGERLEPNATYTLNSYTYSTDNYGRIVETNFPDLQLKDPGRKRLDIVDTKNAMGHGFEKATDDRGHLVADMFNGNNSLANIVPMDGTVNKVEVNAIEQTWQNCLQQGGHVSGSIKITYSGSSFRPDGFLYSYDMGNGFTSIAIPNG